MRRVGYVVVLSTMVGIVWACEPKTPSAMPTGAPPSAPPTEVPPSVAPPPAPAPAAASRPDFDRSLDKRHFPNAVSSEIPYDVDLRRVDYLDEQASGTDSNLRSQAIRGAQREFDIFSWETFLALNWPVTADGRADESRTLADNTAGRVWSAWRSAASIFLPDGGVPAPWTGTPETLPTLFRTKAAWRAHSTSANENFQAFTGPLVDQSGKWVRYEVLVNREEFAYVTENVLYNLEGQIAFSQRPKDNITAFPEDDAAQRRHGATEIKLSWKELDPKKDDRSRFFVSRVKIAPAEPVKAGQTEVPPREVDAGLVGMHIAVHTRSSPEWIWATFEQVDNLREHRDANGHVFKPSFRDPASHAAPNVLAAKNAILDPVTGTPKPAGNATPTTWIESLTTTPTQVERIEVPAQGTLNPLDGVLARDAAELNVEVQTRLAALGSVFRYYELIDTQWPVHKNAPAFAGGAGSAPESITHKVPGDMLPVFLVNSTMETFFMRGKQAAGALEQDDRLAMGSPTIDETQVTGTESCVGCHYSSGICIGFKQNADGTPMIDSTTKQKVPIFGENSHFGKTGNANFSWLFQIESHSISEPPPPAPHNPARFLDVGPAIRARNRVRENTVPETRSAK